MLGFIGRCYLPEESSLTIQMLVIVFEKKTPVHVEILKKISDCFLKVSHPCLFHHILNIIPPYPQHQEYHKLPLFSQTIYDHTALSICSKFSLWTG